MSHINISFNNCLKRVAKFKVNVSGVLRNEFDLSSLVFVLVLYWQFKISGRVLSYCDGVAAQAS